MQFDHAELVRPKTKRLLSTSIDRDELIAAGICVCCRQYEHQRGGIHCGRCAAMLAAADRKAFAGFFVELRMLT